MFKIILAIILALTSTVAMCRDYPREPVFEAVSEVGQSRDEFAASIAPRLREYSDSTGFEACGAIATDGERFGVRIGTSGSHIGCASAHRDVPAGMKSTGVTIHSHGTDEAFFVNRADKLFLPESHHGRRRVEGQVLDQFSPLDYLEPGYLATPTGVIWQDGTGTARVVTR